MAELERSNLETASGGGWDPGARGVVRFGGRRQAAAGGVLVLDDVQDVEMDGGGARDLNRGGGGRGAGVACG